MTTYTVFVRQNNNKGTTYITAVNANNVDEAKVEALEECAAEWSSGMDEGDGYSPDDLFVLGVAAGDVNILEWDDQE